MSGSNQEKRVLVVCNDFKSMKYWFDEVLDVYMDCGLVTSFNRKKNKIYMLGEFVWKFIDNGTTYSPSLYYKIWTQDQLEKAFKERGWVSPKHRTAEVSK